MPLAKRIEEIAKLERVGAEGLPAARRAPRSTSAPTGALDYPDDLLDELDWVVASVHTSFRIRRRTMTERVVEAIETRWSTASAI